MRAIIAGEFPTGFATKNNVMTMGQTDTCSLTSFELGLFHFEYPFVLDNIDGDPIKDTKG